MPFINGEAVLANPVPKIKLFKQYPIPTQDTLVELNVAAKKVDPHVTLTTIEQFKQAIKEGRLIEYLWDSGYGLEWERLRPDKIYNDETLTKLLTESARYNPNWCVVLQQTTLMKSNFHEGRVCLYTLQARNYEELKEMVAHHHLNPKYLKTYATVDVFYIEGDVIV